MFLNQPHADRCWLDKNKPETASSAAKLASLAKHLSSYTLPKERAEMTTATGLFMKGLGRRSPVCQRASSSNSQS